MIGIIIGGLLIFSFLGMPVAFALGVTSLIAAVVGGNPLIIVPQKLYTGLDSFITLAIPFFILAGNIMGKGGISKRIIDTAKSLVGHITGSLSMVTVLASMLFAAISGSGVATVSAIGGVTIPAMKEEGYPAPFAAAVTASAAVTGPIIPPSISLIIYGSIVGVSVSELFIASLVPGLLLGAALMLVCYILAHKNHYPKNARMPLRQVFKTLGGSVWALLMPVIILGGIFGGIFTPTEASVVAVVYSLIISIFVYHELSWKQVPELFRDTVITTGVAMLILGASKVFSWVIVVAHIPEIVSAAILGISNNPVVTLLLINIILLIVGCLMDGTSAIVILTPIFLPLLSHCGLSLIEFGVIMSFNLCIGMLTPPVGPVLLLASDVAHTKMEKTVLAILPFFATCLAVLALIVAVPQLISFLPNLLV